MRGSFRANKQVICGNHIAQSHTAQLTTHTVDIFERQRKRERDCCVLGVVVVVVGIVVFVDVCSRSSAPFAINTSVAGARARVHKVTIKCARPAACERACALCGVCLCVVSVHAFYMCLFSARSAGIVTPAVMHIKYTTAPHSHIHILPSSTIAMCGGCCCCVVVAAIPATPAKPLCHYIRCATPAATVAHDTKANVQAGRAQRHSATTSTLKWATCYAETFYVMRARAFYARTRRTLTCAPYSPAYCRQ